MKKLAILFFTLLTIATSSTIFAANAGMARGGAGAQVNQMGAQGNPQGQGNNQGAQGAQGNMQSSGNNMGAQGGQGNRGGLGGM